jgi:glucokinase
MARRPVIGIDLGGTKVRAGVVSPVGDVLGEARVATQADRDTETVFGNIVSAAEAALREAGLAIEEVEAVGIGSPAPLDIFTGTLIAPNNLPSMHGFPLAERLRETLERPVELNNDANCFGLAEARFGSGEGAEVCCGFTLGTGLGCFLVIRGELFSGPHGAGAEIWCSPYRGDHVEEKCSGRGVARNYAKLTERRITAEQVAERARQGDEQAADAWREFGRDLAVPVAWLCNAADPDVVVFGGSMTKAWDLFGEEMRHEALKYVNAVNRGEVRFERSRLGDAAGMIGAAALVLPHGETGRPAAGGEESR